MKLLFEDSHKRYKDEQEMLMIDQEHFAYDPITAANRGSRG